MNCWYCWGDLQDRDIIYTVVTADGGYESMCKDCKNGSEHSICAKCENLFDEIEGAVLCPRCYQKAKGWEVRVWRDGYRVSWFPTRKQAERFKNEWGGTIYHKGKRQ